jgi:hypothetical protein
MRFWATPFQLSAPALSTLNEAGLQPWPAEDWSALSDAKSLLLYDSPDRLISMVGTGPETEGLTALALLQGYRRLLDWSERTGQPLLAISQLQRLGPRALRSWLDNGDDASTSPVSPLPIPPLLASVCLTLLEAEPALLDCYHDLELRAALLGCDPDLRYHERLLQAGQQGDALLQAFLASQRVQAASSELEKRLASRDTELRELLDERERHSWADAEKQRQLEAGVRDLEELRRSKADQEINYEQAKAAQQRQHDQELEALRQQLEPRLAELEQHLASRDTELREARVASEHFLQELHQVQEALERSVQADAEKQQQLEADVRDLEALRRSKADQESNHEQATAAQQRVHAQELEALRQQLQPQLADLEQHLASRDAELREALEEAAMTLQQLHQLQEVLEQYLLADAEKQRQLEAGVRDLEELRRSKADQESNHEQATAVQQRAHDQELDALREQFEPRLAELEQCLASRETELRQARETAETSLLQLHQQLQEERDRHSMADAEKQRQLEAGVRDLEELRRIKTAQESVHELARAELEQGLASRDTQLRQAREEAEMTFEQLHQAQEELEHYFLKARAGDQLAQAQMEQLQRAQSLLVRLNPDVLPSAPYPSALAVEVLSELPAAMPDPSLQTQALLSTYAASLQRASALLERARRS